MLIQKSVHPIKVLKIELMKVYLAAAGGEIGLNIAPLTH